jgi:hypothetical protein
VRVGLVHFLGQRERLIASLCSSDATLRSDCGKRVGES